LAAFLVEESVAAFLGYCRFVELFVDLVEWAGFARALASVGLVL
jgi:hypothetical protein